MNTSLFWEGLGVRKHLTSEDIKYALAVFAYEYSQMKEQVTNFSPFNSLNPSSN